MDSRDSGEATGPSGATGKADEAGNLLELEGAAAEVVYEALQVEGEFDGAYHTRKSASGELTCMQRTPWGAPASYSCSLGDVLSLDGDDAEPVYEALQVEGEFDGAYHTFKRAEGTLTCTQRTPWGVRPSYSCSFAGDEPPPPEPAAILDIDGDLAEAVYEAINLEGEHDGAYHTFKRVDGLLSCFQRTPWDGPTSHECSMEGVLELYDNHAAELFEALAVEAEHDGGYHTFKKAEGTLTCFQRTPWGAAPSYQCSM